MENEQNIWDQIKFPVIKNIQPKSFLEDIIPLTPEQVREGLNKMIKKLQTIAKEKGFEFNPDKAVENFFKTK